MTRSRWLYHVTPDGDIAVGPEGFVHCSFAPDVDETIRAHFGGARDLRVLAIDPRRVGARIEVAMTPRGPMPHVWGAVPRDAIFEPRAEEARADAIAGTRFGFVAFSGMTLLDLVGMHDPISRIAAMGFDRTSTCEIVGADGSEAWQKDGARFVVGRTRPRLDEFDVLVVPGGTSARKLAEDAGVVDWLRTFPSNRLAVSVCTGALLLGAAGRLTERRATTHASAIGELGAYGATAVNERVVDEGAVITGGGVTAALDVGIHVVREICGARVGEEIARQMEFGRVSVGGV
jgi:cyclohexyl-isocyanide hydratase